MFLLSVAFITSAAAGLAAQWGRRGRLLMRTGVGLLALGALALAGGIITNAILTGDSALWWLHDTDTLGRFMPVAGSLLVAVAMLRDDALRWNGVGLIVGAVLSLGFNAQNDRILFALPLGVAWAALGYKLARREQRAVSTSTGEAA